MKSKRDMQITQIPQKEKPKDLPLKVIQQLGYTSEEFRDLGIYPKTVNDWYKRPLEMVGCKFLGKGQTRVDGRMIPTFPNDQYIMHMTDFIPLWHNAPVQAVNIRRNYNCYRGQELHKKTLLVWMFGSGFGDTLFVNAILRYLKRQYHTCKIHMVVSKEVAPFVVSWELVDKVILTPFKIKFFNKAHYHLHFDSLSNNCEQAKKVNIYRLLDKHANLNIPINELNPYIKVNQKFVNSWKDVLIKDSINDFILFQPQCSSPVRSLRPSMQLDILNRLLDQQQKIVFVDQPSEIDRINNLISQSNDPSRCFNYAMKSKNIVDATALISLAKLVVTVDTSVSHIAAALRCPIYAIHAAFPGIIRLETYPNCKWVDGIADCMPCCLHSQEPCPNSSDDGYSVCLDNIDLDKMICEINSML